MRKKAREILVFAFKHQGLSPMLADATASNLLQLFEAFHLEQWISSQCKSCTKEPGDCEFLPKDLPKVTNLHIHEIAFRGREICDAKSHKDLVPEDD